MKTHTSNFKEEISKFGRQIDSRITFGDTVLGKNDLNAVAPSYQGAILKSVMKQLDIDSNVAIPIGTNLKYEFGLKVNGEYEYINYGNYVVYSIEKQEDTNSYKITCYDKLLYSMLDYAKLPITYPISIRDYINAISTALGLKFANKSGTFANYNKQIQADLYDGLGYTFRDVLDELAQVTASTICLNNNDELEIRYITETGDTIDEEYLKDVNVNFGEKFGKVNTIVLSRSGDSDSVYYPSVLPANPYEIKISDNQIMNGNDRADFLPDIYNKLNGLEFYTNDFVSTGIIYYDLCDRYSVKVGDNTYSCVMFNDEVLVTQGLEENIYTELPEQTETDYKHASKDDRMINQVYIIAKKNEAEILAVVKTTETIQKEINPTKDESGSTITIEDASDNPLTYLEIEGKSEQDTSNQSANLFDEEYYNNDSIYTSGTYKYTKAKFKGNRPLYFRATIKEGKTSQTGAYIAISESAGTPYPTGTITAYAVNNGALIKGYADFTGVEDIYINVYPNNLKVATIFDNYNLWVSTDDIEYVPFVPDSPSPDYPSEIKSVGYENLLDYTTVQNTSNTTTTLIDNGFKVTGLYAGKVFIDNLKPNTNYYLQYITESIIGNFKQVFVFPASSTSTIIKSITNGTGDTFNTGEHTSIQIWFYCELGNTNAETNFTNIMLSEKKHNYIPYGKYGIEVETIGRNIWDEQWEVGLYSQVNGTKVSGSNRIRSKNIFPIPNGVTLYNKLATNYFNAIFYDKDKNFIKGQSMNKDAEFVPPANAYYMAFYTDTSYGAVYNNDICINVSDDKNGEYSPYQERISTIILDEPLRSLPNGVKDIAYIRNNKLYVDRYISIKVLNGSEDWGIYYAGTHDGIYTYHTEMQDSKIGLKTSICSHFTNVGYAWDLGEIGTYSDHPITQYKYFLTDKATVDEFKTWLSTHNIQVDYELAEPYTEELGEIEILKTLKGYNNILTTDELLPIINLTYVRDTVIADYVENHVTELKLTENEIKASVESVNSSVDGLNTTINRVEEITNDNSQVINVISTNIDKTSGEVREVTTTTGFTFNADGMTIDDGSGFKAQHRANGTYYKDGESITGQYTKDGSKQKDLELFGTYSYGKETIDDTPMFIGQLYNDENGEECFGHFYNGEG